MNRLTKVTLTCQCVLVASEMTLLPHLNRHPGCGRHHQMQWTAQGEPWMLVTEPVSEFTPISITVGGAG